MIKMVQSGGTIGWAITFNNDQGNSKSTTTWSGQRQLGSDGRPVILTTWLLTSQSDTSSENWSSTLINQDNFSRSFPRDEKIRATLIKQNFKEQTC